MRRQRWEYCVYIGLYVNSAEAGTLDENVAERDNVVHIYSEWRESDLDGSFAIFNGLGEDGWELVSSIVMNYQDKRNPNAQLVKHLFKRPLKN